MGKSSRKKRDRRDFKQKAQAQLDDDAPKMPPAFQNVVLRPHNCMIILRGKDPKKPLPDGQLLVEIDRYAVIPIEQYQDMQAIVSRRGGVFMDREQVAQKVKELQVDHEMQRRKAAANLARPTPQDIANVSASKVKVQDDQTSAGDDSQ